MNKPVGHSGGRFHPRGAAVPIRPVDEDGRVMGGVWVPDPREGRDPVTTVHYLPCRCTVVTYRSSTSLTLERHHRYCPNRGSHDHS